MTSISIPHNDNASCPVLYRSWKELPQDMELEKQLVIAAIESLAVPEAVRENISISFFKKYFYSFNSLALRVEVINGWQKTMFAKELSYKEEFNGNADREIATLMLELRDFFVNGVCIVNRLQKYYQARANQVVGAAFSCVGSIFGSDQSHLCMAYEQILNKTKTLKSLLATDLSDMLREKDVIVSSIYEEIAKTKQFMLFYQQNLAQALGYLSSENSQETRNIKNILIHYHQKNVIEWKERIVISPSINMRKHSSEFSMHCTSEEDFSNGRSRTSSTASIPIHSSSDQLVGRMIPEDVFLETKLIQYLFSPFLSDGAKNALKKAVFSQKEHNRIKWMKNLLRNEPNPPTKEDELLLGKETVEHLATLIEIYKLWRDLSLFDQVFSEECQRVYENEINLWERYWMNLEKHRESSFGNEALTIEQRLLFQEILDVEKIIRCRIQSAEKALDEYKQSNQPSIQDDTNELIFPLDD